MIEQQLFYGRHFSGVLHGVHGPSSGRLTLLWLAHVSSPMGMAAPGSELTMSFSMPDTHLRLEQLRGGAEFASSVCVPAFRVGALLPVLPGATEHRLAQVWSDTQVQARVCKSAIIIAFTSTEEPGAKFRAAELLSHYWFHRGAEVCEYRQGVA